MLLTLPQEALKLPNVHRDQLKECLSVDRQISQSPPNVDFLFLCFTNRCGSNLVAELLASTGRFNMAGEFFNFDTVKKHATSLGFTSFRQYFDYLCKTLPVEGRLSCKLSVTHLVLLHSSGILEQIYPRSRFLAIERNDRLGQAISFVIASQTQQWTSYMDRQGSDQIPTYSGKQIFHTLHGIVKQQACFDLFFGLNGIEHHTVVYESFSKQPQLYLADAMDWLGVSNAKFEVNSLRVKPQSSETNILWRSRFLQELSENNAYV